MTPPKTNQTKPKYCIYSKRKSKYIDNVLKNFGTVSNFSTCAFIYFLNLFLSNQAVYLKDPHPIHHRGPANPSRPNESHSYNFDPPKAKLGLESQCETQQQISHSPSSRLATTDPWPSRNTIDKCMTLQPYWLLVANIF